MGRGSEVGLSGLSGSRSGNGTGQLPIHVCIASLKRAQGGAENGSGLNVLSVLNVASTKMLWLQIQIHMRRITNACT